MKISPSILSADFANLASDVHKAEAAGADYIHIDAMDGHFVENLTFGPNIVAALRPHTDLPLDCHLMVANPEKLIPAFAAAGADIISIHVEATHHIHGALQLIKKEGASPGVVINPGTPVEMLEPILNEVDLVLVMTVNPGFGGQTFIEETIEKIQRLDQIRKQKGYRFEIEVDGGITDQTIQPCRKAGADVFVAGSYIFGAESIAEAIATLKEAGKDV